MTKITTAIIPSGGLSSRMFPFTKSMNKLMLPLEEKPIIHYLIEELVKSGIKKVIIAGRNLQSVEDYFKKDNHLIKLLSHNKKKKEILNIIDLSKKCKIHYIEEEKPISWVYEVYRARKILENKPFAVIFSDIVYLSKQPAIKQLINEYHKTGKNIASNGRFIFNPDIFKTINKIKFKLLDPGKESETITHAQASKLGRNFINIKGKVFDIGDHLGYAQAMTKFALGDKEISKEYSEFLNNINKNDL